MHFRKEDIPLHPHGDHIKGSGFHSTPGGDLEVGWYRIPPHRTDYRGLPDNICVCPHYGYVLDGRLRIKYPDTGEEEIIQQGEAYYIPARHVFVIEEEVECVEFSPHDKLTECMSAINSNAKKYGYPGAETVTTS